uniref:Uncharacterized protein n=1 Tax=Glossina austeni TaxID=7395 RepID=A0A1A9UH63_GLOAU
MCCNESELGRNVARFAHCSHLCVTYKQNKLKFMPELGLIVRLQAFENWESALDIITKSLVTANSIENNQNICQIPNGIKLLVLRDSANVCDGFSLLLLFLNTSKYQYVDGNDLFCVHHMMSGGKQLFSFLIIKRHHHDWCKRIRSKW